jgi:hypothetical protein
MVLGLTALGEGRMPTSMRIQMAVLHTAGGLVGGALGFGAVWLLLTPIRTFGTATAVVITSAVAFAAVGLDVGVLRPRRRGRQVSPAWYTRYGPRRSYLYFGAVLGAAIGTIRPFAVSYVVFCAAALWLPLHLALLAGALFGLGRTGIIGPASLRATTCSRVLYRARHAHAAWSVVSVAASLVVPAGMAAHAL